MVYSYPEEYLYQYCAAIEKQFSLKLSISRLSRFLAEKDINRKKVYSLALLANGQLQKEAKERDPILRKHWLVRLSEWRADQLVFIDESGINSKLGQRTHGWGKKGVPVVSKVSTQRAENISLLPAFTIDGYLACSVIRGAVDGEAFDNFIEHSVLPYCNPYPGPKSIIVMDNAAIHNAEVYRIGKIN